MENKLKEFREKQGISQTDLAKAIGTTRRTIYSIEAENKDIHIILAFKLAAYFKCSIEDIFIFSEVKDKNSF